MRFQQTEVDLVQWLRSRRSNSLLMALIAHQNTLILLFLLPQSLDLADPSCNMKRYNVWAFSDQVWNTSLHRRRKELPFMVISEHASGNTTGIESYMVRPSWWNCLVSIQLYICRFGGRYIKYWWSYTRNDYSAAQSTINNRKSALPLAKY
jgi:hypothetical protein